MHHQAEQQHLCQILSHTGRTRICCEQALHAVHVWSYILYQAESHVNLVFTPSLAEAQQAVIARTSRVTKSVVSAKPWCHSELSTARSWCNVSTSLDSVNSRVHWLFGHSWL
jgi:hypothetical protein